MCKDVNEMSTEELELVHLYKRAAIGLCVTDRQHRYIRINQQLCDINGKSIEEHIGRTVHEVIPHISDQIVPMFQSVIDSVEPIVGHEVRGHTTARPGEERIFLGDHYPLLSKNGKVLYVHTMVRDITVQRRAEAILAKSNKELEDRVNMRTEELLKISKQLVAEAEKRERVQIELSRKEEMFRHLLQASPDGVLVVDRRGTILHVNEQLLSMFGYTENELLGSSIEKLVPDNIRGKHQGYRNDYSQNPTPRPMGARANLNAKRKDESLFPVDICIAPITYDEMPGTACFVRDVSVRKRIEVEMYRQRAKMAQVSKLSLMGELAGSLAHELNQPLAGILSNAQTIELLLEDDNGPDEEVKEIVGDIVSDTKRASKVIRNLTALFNQKKLTFSPFKLNLLIEETLNVLNSELVFQQVSIKTDLTETLPLVIGNKAQIQQVLINLIMNSIHAMKETDQQTRSILIGADARDLGEIRVWVEDTGPGIDPELMDSLFEPFTTLKNEGMGMGLAICMSILKSHGGKLQAGNKPGGGAKIQFKIPVITSENASTPSALQGNLAPQDTG